LLTKSVIFSKKAWQISGIVAYKSTDQRRLQRVGLGGHVSAKKSLITT